MHFRNPWILAKYATFREIVLLAHKLLVTITIITVQTASHTCFPWHLPQLSNQSLLHFILHISWNDRTRNLITVYLARYLDCILLSTLFFRYFMIAQFTHVALFWTLQLILNYTFGINKYVMLTCTSHTQTPHAMRTILEST